MIRSKCELEAIARLTLGKFWGYPIETLKCADKPDLQDEVHSYGIEVVEDCYPNEKKAERIFDKVWNVPYSDIATKKLAKFEEAGGELKVKDNKIVGGLLGKSGNGPNYLIGVIRDKIKSSMVVDMQNLTRTGFMFMLAQHICGILTYKV